MPELEKSGLQIDFPGFKLKKEAFGPKTDIQLKVFPEKPETYQKGFDLVQRHLRAGNSYLVNYTRKTEIALNVPLETVFQRSGALYKVFSPGRFVFFSPETFVKITGEKIETHPMKGTIEAGLPDAENALRSNVKERAEHYTVVDLLRNDLSLVADEVTVTDFQRIDLLRTHQKDLYAMSSEISGRVKPAYCKKIGSLLHRLLPAGSILGAPKPKTLEIILEAEDAARGFYTGVCGYFDGENLDSCVMIRFIEEAKDGGFFFRSGGGITHLSNLADEYEEMKNKIYVPLH